MVTGSVSTYILLMFQINIMKVFIYPFSFFSFFNSAAAKGNVLRLKSYAAAGADPTTAKDLYGRTPLHAVFTYFLLHII